MTQPAAPEYRLVRRVRARPSPPVLDDAQRRVVEHAGGPLLVLAGPGTGKTTTLVEAAVARVEAGVAVEHLLLLTFSRRAAGELRDRVAARLERTIREPIARTLHSYAFGVLRMAAVRDNQPAPRLLAAAEQDVVIRSLLADGDPMRWPVALRPALRTMGFATELRDFLMRAVERGLDGPALTRLGAARGRPDWVAAGQFLTEYHGVTVLRDPGGFDPAEVIQGALNVLRDDASLLQAERDRRRHIFVDEYQDTDPAQAELVQLLAGGADELIVVGDPDQSIYAFRGADESSMREIDERFGSGASVPVVALDRCRRSGEVLVAATRRLATRLPGPVAHRALVSAEGLPPGEVAVEVFRSASEEAAYVAGVLRAAHLGGLPWSRMAVLVRSTTATLGTLRRAMITAGVPVAVRGDDLPLSEQPAVAMLLAVLELALDPAALTDDLAEVLLIGPLGGGDSIYLRRLRRWLRLSFPEAAAPLADAVRDLPGAQVLPDHLKWPVIRVARVLAAGAGAVASPAGYSPAGYASAGGGTPTSAGGGTPTAQSAEAVLWAMWDASGLSRRWEAASVAGGVAGAAADRDLDSVVQLFDEVARFTDRLPGARPGQFADHLRAQQIPGDTYGGQRSEPDAVAILTAHASKGLEWDLVCVANVQEGSWPDLRRRGSLLGSEVLVDVLRGIESSAGSAAASGASFAPPLAEERRLFYVAATRARQRLVVTAVVGTDEQPSRLLDELDPRDGDRVPAEPLRGVHLPGLVAELRAVACDDAAPARDRRAAAAELARLSAAGVRGADPGDWWGLAELSTRDGAADPVRPVRVSPSRIESFFTCELRTLMQELGVRDDEAVAASLGNLVHELAASAPDGATLEDFEEQLDKAWASIDFGASWFAVNERARATVMLRRLVGWLRESRDRLTRVGVELDFAVEIGDAVVAGRVDRLERDRDGRLVVVDLKTGKSKPRDAEMPTHPQLGTYQLAIQHGAFAAEGSEPGGAVLVQLGRPEKAVEQWQLPLAQADDPEWARRAVDTVAQRMRGFEFSAIENSRCQICDVRTCCPLQVEGRQVTT